MRRQPVSVCKCMAALNHFDVESFLKLALPIFVRPRVHAWPPAGKGNGGNPIARTKSAWFNHARVMGTKDNSTDDGSRGKNWRSQVGSSADHGQRAGLLAINAFREKTPRHILWNVPPASLAQPLH